jgi:hypothetical protein
MFQLNLLYIGILSGPHLQELFCLLFASPPFCVGGLSAGTLPLTKADGWPHDGTGRPKVVRGEHILARFEVVTC